MRKPLREVVRKAQQQGWRVELANHVKLFAPDGRTLIVAGSTESDHRALANTLSRMRRAGFHD